MCVCVCVCVCVNKPFQQAAQKQEAVPWNSRPRPPKVKENKPLQNHLNVFQCYKSITTTLGGMNISLIRAFLFFHLQLLHLMTFLEKWFLFVCVFIVHSSGTAQIVRQERLPFSQKPLMCKLTFRATDVFCLPTLSWMAVHLFWLTLKGSRWVIKHS